MTSRRLRKFLAGLISVLISSILALYIRFGDLPAEFVFMGVSARRIILYVLLSFGATFVFYPFKIKENQNIIFRHLKDSFVMNIIIMFVFSFFIYISRFSVNISRGFTLYFFILDTILMFLFFRLFRSIHDRYKINHKRHTVIVTSKESAKDVIRNLNKYGPLDIEIDALIDDYEGYIYLIHNEKNELTKTSVKSEDYLKKEIVDLVYISYGDVNQSEVKHLISKLETMGITSYLSLSNFNITDSESKMIHSGMINVIEYAPRIFTMDELFKKRLLDIIGAIIGCIVCVFVGIIVGPLIYFEDKGPVIFKQKRVGRNGRYFNMYKFRSMYTDAEERKKDLMDQNEMNGFMFKMDNDPRITKIGKFLRKTSLDEFPQFFNVLKGDMSLVGTRPPTVDEFKQYDAHHRRRLSLKPGITGMWQVSGRSNITDFEEIVKLDTYYIDNWSIWLDFKILAETLISVFKAEGSK